MTQKSSQAQSTSPTLAAATRATTPTSASWPTPPEGFDHLRKHLTPQRVAAFFDTLEALARRAIRTAKSGALNFVLYDCLAGGASQSLRIDTQGKLLGTAILDLELPAIPG